MILDLRRLLSWPFAFAVVLFSIPILLFYLYPSSFWVGLDYNPLGLADALNMAYRIADRQMYFARGMTGHPGVPFYFMSWLALALAGYPFASGGLGFFNSVIEHVERYYEINTWLGAMSGATGVYVFARAAQKLVPAGVVAIGLIVWLASSPATLLSFIPPSIDSFAIFINSLFFVILVRLAYDQDLAPSVAFLSGCVGALAYLNKLSYIYVPLALAAAGILNVAFRKASWIQGRRLSAFSYSAMSWLLSQSGFSSLVGMAFLSC